MARGNGSDLAHRPNLENWRGFKGRVIFQASTLVGQVCMFCQILFLLRLRHDVCNHRLDRANRAGGGAGRIRIFRIGSYMELLFFGESFNIQKLSSDLFCCSSHYVTARSYTILIAFTSCGNGLFVGFDVSTDAVKGSCLQFISGRKVGWRAELRA